MSQDRHEVWIIQARFDESYINYITKGCTDEDNEEPFLEMHQLGPFNTRISKHMKLLGRYILAFVLEQSDAI